MPLEPEDAPQAQGVLAKGGQSPVSRHWCVCRSHRFHARRTEQLRSPAVAAHHKKREDLLDAAICAWTGALWHRFGERRCQVLGVDVAEPARRPIASIIAPARPEQRAA